ncbi:MAG: radical SAM protein [Nanoarchaeota archaeon]|nr:radical SAM protein [Nanoarchaeota archaeon]
MAHERKQCLSIFVTTKCNLNCSYCYTKKSIALKQEHQAINPKFAQIAIDDFFREYPSRHIRFYGCGEPTCEFDLIKKITEYAYKKVGDKLLVELQTNGVFSEQIAEWIANNVNILWISADGPKDIQNINRPTIGGEGSYDVVTRNLKFFEELSHHNNMQLGVRATITSYAITRQVELVNYFHSLGIKYVNAHPACITIDGKVDDIFKWDPIEFAKNFLEAHNKGKELGVYYNGLYISNFDERTRHFCRANIPYPHLTTDGFVSCCDFAQFGPGHDNSALQELIYGAFIPEENRIFYDEDKIHEIRLRNSDRLVCGPCRGCRLAYHCGGGCVGQAILETGSLYGIHRKNCIITRYLGERMPLDQGLAPILHS